MRRAGRGLRTPTRRVSYRSAAGFGFDCEQVLARGEIFVNTRRPLAPGTRCGVVLALEGTAVRIRLEGRVLRVASLGNVLNETPGMTLALQRLPAGIARELFRWSPAGRAAARSTAA